MSLVPAQCDIVLVDALVRLAPFAVDERYERHAAARVPCKSAPTLSSLDVQLSSAVPAHEVCEDTRVVGDAETGSSSGGRSPLTTVPRTED